jgi:hypothetical protein
LQRHDAAHLNQHGSLNVLHIVYCV